MNTGDGAQVTVTDAGPCRKTVQVELPAERVDDAFRQALKSFQRGARVPGFRPGRAPEALVRSRYARELAEEVRSGLVSEGYRLAMEREDLDVVALLDAKDGGVKEGRPLEATFTVDVPPSFPLPEYRNIPIEGRTVNVTGEQVEEALNRLGERMARYEEVQERPVAEGDQVRIDFTASCDGQPLSASAPEARELDQAEDVWCQADEEQGLVPGLGPALVGASVGDTRDIEVTFDDRFAAMGLAGRKALFSVRVKGLRVKIPPEWTPEELGALGVDSLDTLRERLRESLRADAEREEDGRRQRALIRHLLDATSFDLPETVVARETRSAVYDMVRNQTLRGVARDQIETHRERIFEEAARGAKERVTLRYILHRIADQEEVRVKPAEVRERIEALARAYGMEPEKLRAELEKSHRLGEVEEEVRARKTMDLLLSAARLENATDGGEPAPDRETAS